MDTLTDPSEIEARALLLAEISHELRTPLNAVIGFSDAMRARVHGPMHPRYGEYAELIHEAGLLLLDLVGDLQDLARLQAGRLELEIETLDAREPVLAALRLVRAQFEAAGVSLREGLPAAPVMLRADRRALVQIALNLLSNALKFAPRGGGAALELAAAGDAVELSVRDTGPGLAPEDIARLGRPYAQAGDAGQRSRGSGLGLALVKSLAERHGGWLWIDSAPGQGTTVRVGLPGLAED